MTAPPKTGMRAQIDFDMKRYLHEKRVKERRAEVEAACRARFEKHVATRKDRKRGKR